MGCAAARKAATLCRTAWIHPRRPAVWTAPPDETPANRRLLKIQFSYEVDSIYMHLSSFVTHPQVAAQTRRAPGPVVRLVAPHPDNLPAALRWSTPANSHQRRATTRPRPLCKEYERNF